MPFSSLPIRVAALALAIATAPVLAPQCAAQGAAQGRPGEEPRDAAILYAALLTVSRKVALRGGRASALPPGVVHDNALLLEQNASEIRKLTKAGGQS